MVKRTSRGQAAAPRRWSKMAPLGVALVLTAGLAVGIAVFGGRVDEAESRLMADGPGTGDLSQTGSGWPVVEVYKDYACGCCAKWVEHLRGNGFAVTTTDTNSLVAFKTSHRVPRSLQSCHTALVDGYVLEGHVPAADVQRLLSERPDVSGLAVAGMPIGSPGMEVEGAQTQPYDVMAFERDGGSRVFARHGR